MKLLKYEIRKGITLKLILLGLFAIVEGAFIYGCLAANESIATITALLLVFGGLGALLLVGAQSMVTLHHDMNTKQGYLLFMTPKSCYAILGAKLVESLLSIGVTVALAVGTVMLNANLVATHFHELVEMKNMLAQLVQALHLEMTVASIGSFAVDTLFGWIFLITTAYFADVLVSSLLRGKKFGGLLAFILFVVLNAMLNRGIESIHIGDTLTMQTVVHSCVTIAASAVMYVVTARIMETKLSV